MSLDKSVLSEGLKNLVPTLLESVAIVLLSDVYESYCSTAESSLRLIQTPAINTAKPLMASAMTGISTPNLASQKITDGIIAFWVSIAANPGIAFFNAIAITPPPFAGLKSKLDAVFLSNKNGAVNLNTAVSNISDKIDEETKIGGSVTFSDLGGPFPII